MPISERGVREKMVCKAPGVGIYLALRRNEMTLAAGKWDRTEDHQVIATLRDKQHVCFISYMVSGPRNK